MEIPVSDKAYFKDAHEVLNLVAVLIKLAQIHDYNNVAFIKGVSQFLLIIKPILQEESSVTLEIMNDFFYLNKFRIKYELRYGTNLDFLLKEFKSRKIGGITFTKEVTAYDIKIFLAIVT